MNAAVCNFAHFLLSRLNRSLPKNSSCVTSKEVVTSFTFGIGEEEDEHTHKVLPFEANQEGPEGTTDGGQKDAADGVHV